MLYYKIEAISKTVLQPKRKTEEESFKKDICCKVAEINDKFVMFEMIIVEIRKETIVAILIYRETKERSIDPIVNRFFEELKINIVFYKSEEITVKHAVNGIQLSAENGFIKDESDLIEKYGLEDSDSPFVKEAVFYGYESFEERRNKSFCKLCFTGFDDELKRIAASSKKKFYGHPVHYVIMGDEGRSLSLAKIIIRCLHKAHRLVSKRFCVLETGVDAYGVMYPTIYSACNTFNIQKGTAIILHPFSLSMTMGYLDSGYAHIQELCELIKKNQCNTLSIILLEKDDEITLKAIKKELGFIRLVVFKEKLMNYENAIEYLATKAKANKLRNYNTLFEQLKKDDSGYYAEELNKVFNRWYSQHICTSIYPQYSEIEHSDEKNNEEAKGSSYDRLMKMVGLNDAKKVLSEVIAFHTAQKYYNSFGLEVDKSSKHMVFTGNPGSAKTTVARLFAKILKENGVLKKGILVEAGRADIVDQYVGGTAPRVKELFKKAEGGVLFIDEAYSLVDGHRGLYGDEAINTIVQEMENNRDKVIVIFAGYPEKMNQFLDNNPGLRSRIAFHIPFEDYNSEELVDILKLMAEDKKLTLSSDVVEKVKPIFEEARTHKEYGNGRFVRNMFEKAVMHQAGRLVKYQRSELNLSMVSTLVADDFEVPSEYAAEKSRKIGFSI